MSLCARFDTSEPTKDPKSVKKVAREKKVTRMKVPRADLKECLRDAADWRKGNTNRVMKSDCEN